MRRFVWVKERAVGQLAHMDPVYTLYYSNICIISVMSQGDEWDVITHMSCKKTWRVWWITVNEVYFVLNCVFIFKLCYIFPCSLCVCKFGPVLWKSSIAYCLAQKCVLKTVNCNRWIDLLTNSCMSDCFFLINIW